jgi:glycosyltransferase involved in cell wall biosynthesis
MTSPTKALFVLAEFPAYREEVLTAIAADPRIEASFFGDARARVDGIEVFDASRLGRTTHGRNLRFGSLFWQVGALRAIVRVRPKTVVFIGDAQIVSTWALALLCRILGIRTLFWTIGWHRPDRGLKRLTRLAFYRLANGLLLYGRQGYVYGASLGYPVQRMTIIGNSTSGPVPTEQPRQRTARTACVCVGRLTAAKRLDLVITAAARVPGVTVEFVGDGPERKALEELARHEGVDCVFHGESHDPTVLADVYSRAVCTVIPGAAGLSVTQSLAYGVPVITNNSPENQMPEADAVVDGVTGSLCDRFDLASLADAVEHWRSMPQPAWEAASQACVAEYRTNWTPERHADLIVRAIARGPNAASGAPHADYASIGRLVFWQNAPSIHFAPLIRAMADRGYEVHVVTELDLAAERRALGWDSPEFGSVQAHWSPSPDERRMLEVNLGPNSHHVFTGTGAYPQTFESLKRVAADPAVNGRLCVFTESWNPYDWKAPFRAIRYAVRSQAIPDRVDTVLATGALAVSQFKRSVRTSVDVQPFAYSVDVESTAVSDNDGPILFVGKLERRKRVDMLLRAYAAADGLTRRLQIVGDGPERAHLELLAKKLNVSDRVEFIGATTNQVARSLMGRARALVLPSEFDGWGAVVNEALHAGCFVIASSRCGASELLGDGRGAVIRDQAGLTGALISTVAIDPHEARRRRTDWARGNIGPEAMADYLASILVRAAGAQPPAHWLDGKPGAAAS